VGGDIFLAEFFDDGMIVAVVDCTGHGAPGAFMTMIASSGFKRIIRDEGRRLPGDILKRLNFIVKTTLQQDKSYALSDDGLDASICFVKPSENTLCFAGARLPLLVCRNGRVEVLKGDRQSIGYRDSDLSHAFANKTISLDPDMRFYMSTDGITDQLGGPKGISFGKRRLGAILVENSAKPFERQKEILLDAFDRYRGERDRMDDVTVMGFKI
jgi:serine phosphatase RsbU (regulator of sigma subunit)